MYEIRSRELNGRVVGKSENFDVVKGQAERLKKDLNQEFDIYKVEQVWTTQTLDEAMKEK